MSENTKSAAFTPRTASWLPGGRLVGDLLPATEEADLMALQAQILASGEAIGSDIDWFRRQFADPAIIHGLREAEQRTGIAASAFVTNSLKFSLLGRDAIMTGHAVIAQSLENVHHNGGLRRHEEGDVIDLDKVRAQGVDPARVLYYRVTQPSAVPKPEYYWTSDSVEVRGGLTGELGTQATTAIILVSTLESIAQNGGLMEDVNDDQGIAVRQIGLGPFDQSQALFSFAHGYEK